MIRIEVYDEAKTAANTKMGMFYIPDDASKEWVEKNIPPLIRVLQLLAGKIEKTGY